MITCLGYKSGNPSDGYDYDCEYEYAGEFGCEDCICNGGRFDPRTGKAFRFRALRMLLKKLTTAYNSGKPKCLGTIELKDLL